MDFLNLNFINKKLKNKQNVMQKLEKYVHRNKEKIVRTYKNKMKETKRDLMKMGLYPAVKQQIKKSTYNIKMSMNKYNEDVSNKSKFIHLNEVVSNEIENIKNFAVKLETDYKSSNKSQNDDVVRSIIMMVILLAVNTIILTIAFIYTENILAAYFISAVIAAPIIEEYAKRHAIESGFSETFLPIFVWGEYVIYALQTVSLGLVPFLIILVSRLVTAAMHFTTADIQKNVDFGKNRKEIGKKGFILAVLIHAVYNACAIAGGMGAILLFFIPTSISWLLFKRSLNEKVVTNYA